MVIYFCPVNTPRTSHLGICCGFEDKRKEVVGWTGRAEMTIKYRNRAPQQAPGISLGTGLEEGSALGPALTQSVAAQGWARTGAGERAAGRHCSGAAA